jgi:hypothetical protein
MEKKYALYPNNHKSLESLPFNRHQNLKNQFSGATGNVLMVVDFSSLHTVESSFLRGCH